ncbi:MAG: MlaD family protein [Candidatus Cloacimonetes bacterium]|nr:MlaD family protein [Candidatus Cloacimonadota bacterium]
MKFNEKQNQTNFRVGIFVLISLIILILGYLWLTNYLEKGDLTKLRIAFPEAFGLELGDGVLILGVNCGKVTAIDLKGDKVLVSISVKLQNPLMSGTTFDIRDTSVMGSTRVIIQPGNGNSPLNITEILAGTSSPGISSLADKAGSLLSEVELLLARFNTSDNVLDKYSRVADTLQITLQNVNDLVITNSEKLSQTITSIADTSELIAEIISNNQSAIDSTLSGSNELVDNLGATSDSIRELSQKIRLMAQQLQNENSTYSRLTTDDELYQNLLRSTASLDSLINDIKKNPKKYLTVKIF